MQIYKRIFFLITFAIVTVFLLHRNHDNADSAQVNHDALFKNSPGDWMNRDGKNQQQFTTGRLPADPSSFQAGPDTSNLSSTLSPFHRGTPKSPGSTYTKAVIMGRLSSENITWLETTDLPANIQTYIYNVDKTLKTTTLNSLSPTLLSLPTIKGHEAMVYLTYIIDHYTSLPDISIFLHAHQLAWHNNELLNHDAAEMIKRLSSERVAREGYMNLRCHWKPGCPEYIFPQTPTGTKKIVDPEKREEAAIAEAWADLFPDDPVPDVLAAACCAQFAVSRERVLEVPLRRFVEWRRWLVDTPLSDYVSGRVFEYLWQKIFAGVNVDCPDMRVCYCDGFGVCFEDAVEFDYWFEIRWRKREVERKLREWREDVKRQREGKGRWRGGVEREGGDDDDEGSDRGLIVDGDTVLQREIDGYSFILEDRRLRAIAAGTDPRIRARVAGRPWKDGDGF